MRPATEVKKPSAFWDDLLARPEDPEQRLNAYMTHELRAPLTSVRSALGFILSQLEGRLRGDELQALELAVKNADRLDRLIDDVMDFSKLRAGKLEVELKTVSSRDMAAEAVDSLRSWALAKGVKVSLAEPPEPLPRVRADPSRTVQVLVNLLSNAIKFTPRGGKIEVSAALGRGPHAGTLEFRVKDSGPGIPHKDLERVFACFEQSALGAKSSSGTGLGLTIAKALVELQGGRIWAESWRGLGASLHFTLPLSPEDIARPVEPYPRPVEYHGVLVEAGRRMSSFVAALFA